MFQSKRENRRMSLSLDNLSTTLNTIQRDLYRYVLIPFLAFGTVGNLFNLIVFVQPYLRTNPCSIYLLSYTFVSLFWLDFMSMTSLLNIGFSIDIGAHSLIACQTRTYIAYVGINLLPDFLILAAFDRTCVCSRRVTVRQYSSVKVAVYSICSVTLFWLVFNIPTWFYTSIQQMPSGQPICTPLPGNPFNDFIFIFFAITCGILPIIILITLG